jgi:hypothetical protein
MWTVNGGGTAAVTHRVYRMRINSDRATGKVSVASR